jgi:hypothetical protein
MFEEGLKKILPIDKEVFYIQKNSTKLSEVRVRDPDPRVEKALDTGSGSANTVNYMRCGLRVVISNISNPHPLKQMRVIQCCGSGMINSDTYSTFQVVLNPDPDPTL